MIGRMRGNRYGATVGMMPSRNVAAKRIAMLFRKAHEVVNLAQYPLRLRDDCGADRRQDHLPVAAFDQRHIQ